MDTQPAEQPTHEQLFQNHGARLRELELRLVRQPPANRSETIAQIAAALAEAQGKITHASKDRKNDHFKSSYATLASVWEACRGALAAAGVSVVQSPTFNGTVVSVETLLAHASGEWMSSILHATPAKTDAQGIGSTITYLRRYGLSAMVGVAPDDDDDGEAAEGRSQQQQAQPARQQQQSKGGKGRAQQEQQAAQVNLATAHGATGTGTPDWKPQIEEAVAMFAAAKTLEDLAGAAGILRDSYPDNHPVRKAAGPTYAKRKKELEAQATPKSEDGAQE